MARRAEPLAAPAFYVGNVLPDLISSSGVGRLRDKHAAGAGAETDLLRGVRLHLATDRRFHGHPAFAGAQADAKAALLAVPFSVPLHRVFFLAHAFVEVALDGLLMRRDAEIAHHFYSQFDALNLDKVAADAAALLGLPTAPPELAATLHRFTDHRYLYGYADGPGQAEAMYRLSHRAGVGAFATESDRVQLAHLFDAFTPTLARHEDALLTPPQPADAVVK